MKQYSIGNLIIEVTRQCNMFCDHCLRGDAQRCDLDLQHVETLFQHVESIDTLTLTGGEPSLVPHIIDGIIELASKYHIPIERFYMATNGMDISDKFMLTLIKLWNYCENSDDEYDSCLDISNDGYHGYEEEYYKKLSVFKFTRKKSSEDYKSYDDSLIKAGRVLDNYSSDIGRDNTIYCFEVEEDNIGDANIYLNCNGDILPDCDLSYDQQDEEALIVCNIHEVEDLGKAYEDFNERVDEANAYLKGEILEKVA